MISPSSCGNSILPFNGVITKARRLRTLKKPILQSIVGLAWGKYRRGPQRRLTSVQRQSTLPVFKMRDIRRRRRPHTSQLHSFSRSILAFTSCESPTTSPPCIGFLAYSLPVTMSRDTFLSRDAPSEVLVLVLGNCASFRDILSLALTCKHLHSVWRANGPAVLHTVARRCVPAFDIALLAVCS